MLENQQRVGDLQDLRLMKDCAKKYYSKLCGDISVVCNIGYNS